MQSNDYDMVFWYLASSHFDFWQASIPQPQEAAKRQNTGDFNWPYFDDGHAPGTIQALGYMITGIVSALAHTIRKSERVH